MKGLGKRLVILVLCTVLLLLTACQSENTATGKSGDKKIKIGLAMKTEVQPRWKFELKFMEEKAKELGAEIIVQWANDDVTKQGNQIENLLSQGIDALIVVPVTDKIGPYVEKAKMEGVPVVSYDALPKEVEVDLFVTRDNYKVGELQTMAALDYVGEGESNIVVLKGDPASTVAQGIAEAYDEILKDKQNIKIVAEQWHQNWSTEEALKTAENALSAQNDNIKAFLSSSDGLAMGVAQAVKGRGMQGQTFISGLDVELGSARMIAEGTQTMSIWTKIDDQARKAIIGAVQLAKKEELTSESTTNNGKYDVPTVFADVMPVDQNNLCSFIKDDAPEGWMKIEDVYKDVEAPEGCK
ncbi:substrate-binding domain-containing protein [Bacillus sp. FJAT-50079]|uniref:sugar ABC transporter substrate-binding protein n=1 Tax=Bacillus sp. FJAT-50079 TaxID=2833577 RepID=UPI001BC8F1AA|nr:substrate-binding domain-containing protein [Bacillus sp. FJAT-50079]MBS4206649.1 substrate-binding domain-containing protein [Bacillus sp. FJAT-50079]